MNCYKFVTVGNENAISWPEMLSQTFVMVEVAYLCDGDCSSIQLLVASGAALI